MAFGGDVFERAGWLEIQERAVETRPFLKNSLDLGEASVIQTAMDLHVPLVCIDEAAGRRIARLCGLNVTGSVGVLLKARQMGHPDDIRAAIQGMRDHGIWFSDRVVQFALTQAE